MDPTIKASVNALRLMAESESTVAEFYRLCSERFTENNTFWYGLAREEMAHAQVIERLIELVRVQPGGFKPGKPTPLDAIKSFIKRTQSNVETVHRRELLEEQALLMAYQIENTFIELRYGEAVNTDNEEFKSLLGQVISDTLKHKNRVVARIRKMREESKLRKKQS